MKSNRLPRQAIPNKYEILIEPDLSKETFSGAVNISVNIVEETNVICLHAYQLEFESITITTSDKETISCEWSISESDQTIEILVPNQLSIGLINLNIRYKATIKRDLVGFYISEFKDENDQKQKIASTQFQAPNARRCFPCWDEPDFKAIFKISVLIDKGLEAVSNGSEISRTNKENKTQIDFAETMPISTYLVALVVGPLKFSETVNASGVELRVVHRPGKEKYTKFAMDVSVFALDYLKEFFGIEYFGKKIDLIGIPDFQAGAMENQGCITFREAILLVDADNATQAEQQRAASVIAHELAHMWFGNLVTLKWWNGLWLNEAFATFMEMKVTDAYKPEWDRWTDFSLSLSQAYSVDSTSCSRPIEFDVETPEEAEAMFDVLTYEKGAALVRMLEQYVGEEKFKLGLQKYMSEHKFSNTETSDLWDSIEAVSEQPVRSMMESWIFQMGFPVLNLEINNSELVTSQSQVQFIGSPEKQIQHWDIPLNLRIVDDRNDFVEKQIRIDEDRKTINLESEPKYVLANAHGTTFTKINYSSEMLENILNNLENLSSIERYNIIDDTWSSVLQGNYSCTQFLNLLEDFASEDNRAVWQRIIIGLNEINYITEISNESALQTITKDLIYPRLKQLGLTPEEGEADVDSQLRGELIKAMGTLANDPEIQDECRRTAAMVLRNPELVDPSVASASILVTATYGDEADFDDFMTAWQKATSPQEELRYLTALSFFKSEELSKRFFKLILEKQIRSQSAPFLLRSAMMGKVNGFKVWEFVSENWAVLNKYISENSIPRMIEGIVKINSSDRANEISQFLAKNKLNVGEMTVKQHIEKMQIQVALNERESANLNLFLKSLS